MNGNNVAITDALESISQQLNTVIRLVAASQIEGLNQKETVEHLGRIGLDARTISEISGHPVTSVAPTLSRLKASRRPRRSRRRTTNREEQE